MNKEFDRVKYINDSDEIESFKDNNSNLKTSFKISEEINSYKSMSKKTNK